MEERLPPALEQRIDLGPRARAEPLLGVLANGRDITFTDGTKLFLGSSGTGAPYELRPENTQNVR